ncbi:aminotransferase-like domain-containing protein [Arenibacterium sp. CAU 1754]
MGTISQPSLANRLGPKYKAVAELIRNAIDSGEMRQGAKLPPVRELAYQLNITPGTVARAYALLTDEGLLLAEVGRGTFVAPPKSQLQDDVWSRIVEPRNSRTVSLFSPRLPDVGQVAAIRHALLQVADGEPHRFLNYPTREAFADIRQVVADWLSTAPLGPVAPEDVVLTHGGQSAICLVLQAVVAGPKPTILVEDLSYAGFRRAAELMRADVVGVEMDEYGVIPEALDAAIRRSGAQVFCTSPEVHNPTGCFTPLERRKALVEVINRHDIQILEDDCYRISEPRAHFYRALAPTRTWYVASISKSLTPALRVGFALGPTDRGGDLRRVAEYSYFGVAQPIAEVTRILLSDPNTPELMRKVRARLADYVRVAVNALGGFDLTWNPEVPFVWLRLPPGWRAAAFCRAAENEGVQIRSADEFALRDGRAPHAVRIAMNGQVSLDSFEQAMQRLRMLLDNPPEQISV